MISQLASFLGGLRTKPELIRVKGDQLVPELLVGERGFEPPTPWSRTRCSTRLSHSPMILLDATVEAVAHNDLAGVLIITVAV
jgi:hypothetical protein